MSIDQLLQEEDNSQIEQEEESLMSRRALFQLAIGTGLAAMLPEVGHARKLEQAPMNHSRTLLETTIGKYIYPKSNFSLDIHERFLAREDLDYNMPRIAFFRSLSPKQLIHLSQATANIYPNTDEQLSKAYMIFNVENNTDPEERIKIEAMTINGTEYMELGEGGFADLNSMPDQIYLIGSNDRNLHFSDISKDKPISPKIRYVANEIIGLYPRERTQRPIFFCVESDSRNDRIKKLRITTTRKKSLYEADFDNNTLFLVNSVSADLIENPIYIGRETITKEK